jgi:hypothetical protein
MLYLYGDSHARFSFKGLTLPYIDRHEASITMFRIGRDNHLINFNPNEHDNTSILCFVYGEVDCRCHIQRQIDLGRLEDKVVEELVTNYINTIKSGVKSYKKIIITGVIPPTNQNDFEQQNGPIEHEFPFVGNEESRVRYTNKVNHLLQEHCKENNFIYFNPYLHYTRDDGTLKYELSDRIVHLGDTTYFLERFNELYKTIVNS